MVARGDLGVEIGAADVPLVQKRIIRLGLAAGKPVITATQMLESMICRARSRRARRPPTSPTRSSTARRAVMLSGETAVGAVPDRGRRRRWSRSRSRSSRAALLRRATADAAGLRATSPTSSARRRATSPRSSASRRSSCRPSRGESAREVSKHRPRRPDRRRPRRIRACCSSWRSTGPSCRCALEETSPTVEEQWRRPSRPCPRRPRRPGRPRRDHVGHEVNRPGATNTILVQAL